MHRSEMLWSISLKNKIFVILLPGRLISSLKFIYSTIYLYQDGFMDIVLYSGL